MSQEDKARAAFEKLMGTGCRPDWYPLKRLAGGEYYSPHTEHAWKFYRDGYLKREE
jgi:hypothetical protein